MTLIILSIATVTSSLKFLYNFSRNLILDRDKHSWVTNIFDNTVVHEKKENPSYVERKNHFQGSVSCVGGRTLCLSQTVRHGGSSIDLGVAVVMWWA